MSDQQQIAADIKTIRAVNFAYGMLGLAAFYFFRPTAMPSFVAGWAVVLVNFELFKKLFEKLINKDLNTEKLSIGFYFVLLLKMGFWAMVLAFLMLTKKLDAIGFLAGTLTILIAGLVLARTYART